MAGRRSAISKIAVAKAVQAVASVGVAYFIARGVGAAGQGQVEEVMVWPLLLMPFASFALPHGAVAVRQEGTSRAGIVTAVAVLAAATTIVSLCVGASALWFAPPDLGLWIGIVGLCLLPAAWMSAVATSGTWISGDSTSSSVVEASQSVLRASILAGMLVLGVISPTLVVAVLVCSWVFVAGVYFVVVLRRNLLRLTRGGLLSTLQSLVGVTLPTTLNVLLVGGLLRLDVLLLLWHDTPKAEVGQYAVALKVGELLWFIPLARSQVFLVESAGSDVPPFAVRRSDIALTFLAGLVLLCALSLGGERVLGSDFSDVAKLFAILLAGIVAYSALPTARNFLILQGQAWRLVKIMVAAVIFNVLGNMILIPLLGVGGAAMASSAAYVAVAVAIVASAKRALAADLTFRAKSPEEVRSVEAT